MKEKILETLKEMLCLFNDEPDRAEEIASLEEQIAYLQKEIWKERNAKYVANLKHFKEHLNSCFDVLMGDDCTDETVDAFYSSDFTITFRGKSVTLNNGAVVFQSVEDIIQTEIDEEEI